MQTVVGRSFGSGQSTIKNQESRIETAMGAEAKCTLTFGKTKADGKALLETDALIFRGGDVRLSVPYKSISRVEAASGALRVTFSDGVAVFAIGDAAPKWAAKILNPPSRLDKLGVKREHRVLVL